MNTKELCTLLGVKHRVIVRLRQAGVITGHKFGREYRYTPEEYQAARELLQTTDNALTTRQLCEALGITPGELVRLRRRRIVVGVKRSVGVFYSQSDVEAARAFLDAEKERKASRCQKPGCGRPLDGGLCRHCQGWKFKQKAGA